MSLQFSDRQMLCPGCVHPQSKGPQPAADPLKPLLLDASIKPAHLCSYSPKPWRHSGACSSDLITSIPCARSSPARHKHLFLTSISIRSAGNSTTAPQSHVQGTHHPKNELREINPGECKHPTSMGACHDSSAGLLHLN